MVSTVRDTANGIGDLTIYPFMMGWTNLVRDLKLDARLGIYVPTGDRGSYALLGDFKWPTYSVGPVLSYVRQVGKTQLLAEVKWLPELVTDKRIELELGYQAIVTSEEAGRVTHHSTATLEIDLTRRLDLDVSFIWDRTEKPQADGNGDVPQQNDFRLNLSLGVKF